MTGITENDDPEKESFQPLPLRSRFLKFLGPGLVTGASDDDPSGIATYSQAGAQFGYGLGWTLIYTLPLMIAVQMISARIGRVTGKGLAGVLRDHYPNWLLQIAVGMLLIANTINLGADLGAMGDAVALLLPGRKWAYIIGFGVACILMQVFFSYARYISVLKWLSLSLFAYVATLAVAQVDWPATLLHCFVPQIDRSSDFLSTVVAVFGTTISPYLFFWQSSQEAEEVEQYPNRKELLADPKQGEPALARISVDTIVGMSFSNIIALSILTTAAATYHPHGITDIQTSAEAAKALEPIAGHLATLIFSLGIIGTGLLAVPVLGGSAAYAVGEALRWPVGFSRELKEARAFYGAVALATLVGMGIVFVGIDPIKALFWSAVLNGIIAVPIMIIMMLTASRHDVLGRFVIRGCLQFLGWMATGLMVISVLTMFGAMIFSKD